MLRSMATPSAFGRRTVARRPMAIPPPAPSPRVATGEPEGPNLKALGLDSWSSVAGAKAKAGFAPDRLPWRWIGVAAGVFATVGLFFVAGPVGDGLQTLCGVLTVAGFVLGRRKR